MRTSIIVDDDLMAVARDLGINVSEAAREGLRRAVRDRLASQDRAAYLTEPEQPDEGWDEAESWGDP